MSLMFVPVLTNSMWKHKCETMKFHEMANLNTKTLHVNGDYRAYYLLSHVLVDASRKFPNQQAIRPIAHWIFDIWLADLKLSDLFI